MTGKATRLCVGLSGGALFGLATAFPAIGTCSRDPARMIDWFDSSTVLFFGGLGPFAGQIGWFANLALVANLVSLLRGHCPRRGVLILHALLFTIGGVTLQPGLHFELPHNEAWSEPICRLGAGFWIWAASHLTILGGAFALRRSMRDAADPVALPGDASAAIRLMGDGYEPHVDRIGSALIYSLPVDSGVVSTSFAFAIQPADLAILLRDSYRRAVLETIAHTILQRSMMRGEAEVTSARFADLVRRVLHGDADMLARLIADVARDHHIAIDHYVREAMRRHAPAAPADRADGA
jgi:hypothetical protein